MPLLLIDLQNDYFPGGRAELAAPEAAVEQAAGLLAAFRAQALPVIHVQHVSIRPGATFFLPDTDGVRIHERVAPAPGEIVIEKHFPNAFRETTLREILDGYGSRELVVAGMMTHLCVDSTLRAAFDLGYTCTLAHDACATKDLRFGETVIPAGQVQASFLAALGMFARIVPARAACDAAPGRVAR
jgi:nicotinamidase-related amidase